MKSSSLLIGKITSNVFIPLRAYIDRSARKMFTLYLVFGIIMLKH